MKKIWMIALTAAALFALTGCASRVILTDDTPGAKVQMGTVISFEQREKKVGVGTDTVENTAIALSETSVGKAASLAFAMFNRLSEGPYMELRFRLDGGTQDDLLPFRMGSPLNARLGDRIKLITLEDYYTVYNLTDTERLKAAQAPAKK